MIRDLLILVSLLNSKEIGLLEFQITEITDVLQDPIEATKQQLQKKQSRTQEEVQAGVCMFAVVRAAEFHKFTLLWHSCVTHVREFIRAAQWSLNMLVARGDALRFSLIMCRL